MNQLGPFAVLIGLAAVVLAGLGGAAAWWNEESRRLRRGLRNVLGEAPHAMIVAPGRGRAAGFNFTSGAMAVAWDGGGWCLVYRIDELVGIELAVDGQVVARSWRGETRRALDNLTGAEREVGLRLVFDDPHNPDFTLDLWSAADEGRRGGHAASEAVAEGNRWIARTESLFRRRPAAAPARVATRAEPPPAPEPEATPPEPLAAGPEPAPPPAPPALDEPPPPPPPISQELPFDAPPWDEEDDDDTLSGKENAAR